MFSQVNSCVEARVIQLSSLEHVFMLHITVIVIGFPGLISYITSLGTVEYLLQTDWILSRWPAGFYIHSLKVLIDTSKMELCIWNLELCFGNRECQEFMFEMYRNKMVIDRKRHMQPFVFADTTSSCYLQ